jgi:hypothetical protein
VTIKTPIAVGLSLVAVVGLSIMAAVNSLRYSIASVVKSGQYIRITIFVDNPLERVFLQHAISANVYINSQLAGRISDCTVTCIDSCTRTLLTYDVPLSLSYNPKQDFSMIQGRSGINTRIMILGSVRVGAVRVPIDLKYVAI